MPRPVISRDSLSRCEEPSMLYDTVRNPNARPIPKKIDLGEISKDTIQSTQHRLNRQMLEKLESLGFKLPHDSFVAVVQVGKYLFLAVMLPPYLALYGLPKWLLLMALPNLFNFAKEGVWRFGQYIQTLSTHLVDLMKGILDQTLGHAMRMSKQFLKKRYEAFQQFNQKIATRIQNELSRITAKIEEVQNRVKERVLHLSEAVKELVNKVREEVKQKALKPIKNIFEKGGELFSQLSNVFSVNRLTQALQFFQTQAHLIRTKREDWGKMVSEKLAKMKADLKMMIPMPSDLAKSVYSLLLTPFDKAKEKLSTLNEKIKEISKSAKEKIKKIQQSVVDKARESAEAAKEMAIKVIKFVPELTVQLAAWMWGISPASIKGSLRSIKEMLSQFKRSMKKYKAFATAVFKAAKRVHEGVVEYVREKISWIGAMWRQFLLWLRKELIELPQRVIRLVKRIAKRAVVFSRKMGHVGQISFAILRALVVFAYLVFKEMLEDATSWLPGREQQP